MNQEERKTAIRRMRVLVAAACILMLLYGLRLIFCSWSTGMISNPRQPTPPTTSLRSRRHAVTLWTAGGERIATSVTGYNVVLNKLLMGDEDLDGMLPEDRRAAACQR